MIEYHIVKTESLRDGDAEVVHVVFRVFHDTVKEQIETQFPLSRDEARELASFLRNHHES